MGASHYSACPEVGESANIRDQRSTEMEICLEVHGGIEKGPIPMGEIGEVSISDVRGVLASEPDCSKKLDYF